MNRLFSTSPAPIRGHASARLFMILLVFAIGALSPDRAAAQSNGALEPESQATSDRNQETQESETQRDNQDHENNPAREIQDRDVQLQQRDDSGRETIEPATFIRIRKDDQGNDAALQTAITRYRPADGEVIIDLIGAVHIGEADYYRRLNDQMDLYDVVLYELVAPQGTRVPAGGAREEGMANPIGMLQQSAQRMLGLESQLAMIDYQQENFVHADLSPAEMQEKMAERGDSAFTVGLSALSEMIRNQNRAAQESQTDPDNAAGQLASESMFELMSDPKKMKLMMASQFATDGAMEAGLGQTLNQLIVTDRNEAAMRVLQQQLASGRTRIAIFYGAAHMPDFEQRLNRDFGLTRTDQVWVDAWDLQKEVESPASDPMRMMMQLLKSLDE